MPRASSGLERAKKTADRYITRSGGTPSPDQVEGQVCGRDDRGFELAKHKEKIRKQREEIDKLKRSVRTLRDKLSEYVT
jgi:hypothetical protein